jgi:hypothetical protein
VLVDCNKPFARLGAGQLAPETFRTLILAIEALDGIDMVI